MKARIFPGFFNVLDLILEWAVKIMKNSMQNNCRHAVI
jgi:hypothetical protein